LLQQYYSFNVVYSCIIGRTKHLFIIWWTRVL